MSPDTSALIARGKSDPPPKTPEKSGVTTAIFAACFVIGVGVALGVASMVATQALRLTLALWYAGAVGLGLISGYSTGASEKTGSASEFLKFVSTGVVVPLLGAMGIVKGSTSISESSTYAQDQLVKKVTDTSGVTYEAGTHPLAVLGGFFLFYSLSAAAGVIIGIHHRSRGVIINMVP